MAGPLLYKGYPNNNGSRPGDSNPGLAEDRGKEGRSGAASQGREFHLIFSFWLRNPLPVCP